MSPVQKLDLSLIVATTPGGKTIWRNSPIQWRLPSEQHRFAQITTKIGVVIMGLETCEFILTRNDSLLPGRYSIVLSEERSPLLRAHSISPVKSVEEAYKAIRNLGGRACIIGEEQVCTAFLPLVQTAFVTMVNAPINGDAHSPMIGRAWQCENATGFRRWHPSDEYATSFCTFVRKTTVAEKMTD